jgi:hypothetical protein
LGKSFDTHGLLGPWLTTADEIPYPHALEMVLTVNGKQRQRDVTSGMIYNIFQQIAYMTTVMTLLPGDVLATGTPAGVGIAQGQFLRDGDVVKVEITGLGGIEHIVRAERKRGGKGLVLGQRRACRLGSYHEMPQKNRRPRVVHSGFLSHGADQSGAVTQGPSMRSIAGMDPEGAPWLCLTCQPAAA